MLSVLPAFTMPLLLPLMETPSELSSHHFLDVDPEPSLLEPKVSLRKSKTSSLREPESSKASRTLLLLELIGIFSSSLIIDSPFLWVFEQLICVNDLRELLLSPRVLLIAIWVIFS